MHQQLVQGLDAQAHRPLVATNGVRTVAWGLRSALVLYLTAHLLKTS